MNALLNKRGLEIAIGTVAVIAVVLLVIIVVIGFFLGGFGRAGSAITDISGEGEEGASNLSLEFKCLGTVRMTNNGCASLNNAGQSSPLCSGATVNTGATCSSINEPSICNDVKKAKGCYWGFGQ